MMTPRAKRGPRGALASLASLAFVAALAATPALTPLVSAQVLGSAPYVPAPDPAVERLQSRLDQLEGELRRAIGQNEQLTFQLSNARRTAEEANSGRIQLQKDVEALSARVAALEALARGDVQAQAGVATQPGEATINLTGPSDGGASSNGLTSKVDLSAIADDEAALMKEARNLLLAGDYPSAQAAFGLYLSKYAKSDNAAEAQYLLGESLLYQGTYPDAAEAYGKLLSDYPKSERGPEALVKLARSMRLMNNKSQACKALGLMSTQFPKASNAAKTLAATEKSRAGC